MEVERKTSSTQKQRSLPFDQRLTWLGLALISLIVSTWLAVRQSPHPDPWRVVKPLSLEWLAHPLEDNAYLRLPVLSAALNDISHIPDHAQHLVAVGDGGLIIFSDDGGEHWRQAEKTMLAQPEPNAAYAPPSGGSPSKSAYAAKPPVVARSLPTESAAARINLNSLHFIDSKRGWAGGEQGVLFSTVDGGRHWQQLSLRTDNGIAPAFDALHFIDAQQGWARSGETVWKTVNAGLEWQPATPAPWPEGEIWPSQLGPENTNAGRPSSACFANSDLIKLRLASNRVVDFASISSGFFLNADLAWLGSHQGRLFLTSNGGSTWQSVNTGSSASIACIVFINASQGWLLTADGKLFSSRTSGRTWQALNANGVRNFYFSDEQHGWYQDEHNSLFGSDDGGASWRPLTRPAIHRQEALTSNVHPFSFKSDSLGLMANGPALLRSTDGGRLWQVRVNDPLANYFGVAWQADEWQLFELRSISGERVSGDLLKVPTAVMRSKDEGQRWSETPAFQSVEYMEANQAAFNLNASEAVNQFQTQYPEIQLSAVEIVEQSAWWGLADHGQLLFTGDKGKTVSRVNLNTRARLTAMDFADDKIAWLASELGEVWRSDNGGESWQKIFTAWGKPIEDMQFLNAEEGWLMTRWGSVLRTSDGGMNWVTNSYRKGPAPWYYLSWLLTGLLLLPALRKPTDRIHGEASIADVMASDRPLRPGDPDPLQFNAIARSLSRLIRNEQTEPPLTIAVSGPWGSGKSSLMNLLSSDLKSIGFNPVWFNVWHHQKEEHMLAALLTSIRKQAIPSWLTSKAPFINLDALRFRYRLLLSRGPRHLMMWLLMLLILATSTPFVVRSVQEAGSLSAFATQIEKLASSSVEAIGGLIKNGDKSEDASSNSEEAGPGKFTFITFSLALIYMLAAVYRAMIAFGINPTRLMASIDAEKGRAGQMENRLSFRFTFAQEFKEVTDALHPFTMVIFLDDLDRCRSQRVLEVLEAVNFLVSSGNCILVIGMDYDIVQNSVALEYKALASQLLKEGENEEQAAERFAAEYLEKLINIQVPVPRMHYGNFSKVMHSEDSNAGSASLRKIAARVKRVFSSFLPYVVIGLVLLFGWTIGDYLSNTAMVDFVTDDSSAVEEIAQAIPSSPDAEDEREASSQTQMALPPPPSASSAEEGSIVYMQQADSQWKYYLILPLAWIALAVFTILRRKRHVIIRDSQEFNRALTLWAQLISRRRNTPRAIKRFLNRTRYFAMRIRDEAEADLSSPLSMWQALLGWIKGKQERPTQAQQEELKEAQLVAMSALHHYNPNLLQAMMFGQFPKGSGLLEKYEEILDLLQAHEQELQQYWPPSPEQWAQFQRLSTGITVK